VEDDLYNKLKFDKRLSVQARKKDKILAAHVQCICEAHDTGTWHYYQQIHGSSETDTTTSMKNLGEQAYVYITLNTFVNTSGPEERWKRGKASGLSRMSKRMVLHTKGTANVSEFFNVSNAVKKLY